MTRRQWMCLPLLLGACRKQTVLPPDLFPETAATVWRRTALGDLPASEAPDPVPRTAVDRLQTAAYQGPGRLQARVYALASPAVGLELAKRWQPSSDTVFFNSGAYFVVVKWQEADRQSLQAFVRELETKLAPAGTKR